LDAENRSLSLGISNAYYCRIMASIYLFSFSILLSSYLSFNMLKTVAPWIVACENSSTKISYGKNF